MSLDELLQQIKVRLEALYGERLRGIVLYGSEARGESREDSDIDILCLLEGPISMFKEIRATTEATYQLQLDFTDRIFHVMPADVAKYDAGATGFFRIVRREGALL